MNIERLIDDHYKKASDLRAQSQAEESIADSLQTLANNRWRRRVRRYIRGERVWPPMSRLEKKRAEMIAETERKIAAHCAESARLAAQAQTQTTWDELLRRI